MIELTVTIMGSSTAAENRLHDESKDNHGQLTNHLKTSTGFHTACVQPYDMPNNLNRVGPSWRAQSDMPPIPDRNGRLEILAS